MSETAHQQQAQRIRLLVTYLDGDAPVQAYGTVNDYPFYFWARGNGWKFAVGSTRKGGRDEAIRVATGEATGFVLNKRYGQQRHDASIMAYELAMTLIRRCALAFVAFTSYQEQGAS